MHEIRCPSCQLRLWRYQGMSRDVPLPQECPGCHLSRPIDRPDVAHARIASGHRAGVMDYQRAGDTPRRPRVGAGALR